MRRGGWAAALAVQVLVLCGAAAPASAGTYDVVSCGAPGAGGVNRAWTLYPGFDERYWNQVPSCPTLSATSDPAPGVRAGYFTGTGFHVVAPAGAILDRMVIWRHGYRFNSTGTAQGPWVVGGFRGDGTVIGGPLAGETCNIAANQLSCDFGAPGMADAARIERDLETNEVLYNVSCFDQAGCVTANDQGFPFTGVFISGSVITVRDETLPAVTARGALLAGGWITTDAPLSFGATDNVGIRQLRVLVDGAQAQVVQPPCDVRLVAPCGQVAERAQPLGGALPDGVHTVGVEATDSAGNVGRVERQVQADRNPPALAFAPSRGRGRRVVVDVPDAGTGAVSGSVAVRRKGRFRAVPSVLRGAKLVARLGRSRAGLTLRATAADGIGHSATITGTPVRLRAGFGPRLRASVRGGLRRGPLVRGRLRAWGGRGLAGRTITITQRLRQDGAGPTVAATAQTGARGRFRVRLPAGGSRALRVTSPGTGGLQAGLRTLGYRVPWSSTLRIEPRRLAPGGRIRITGRLRLRGATLPASGARVELQAFDRGRWRVFATTRTRGARARWEASYRFGTRAGSYRIRARIPAVGSVPYDRGYTRPVTVTVG
jgi:hypothetical protein